MHLTDLRAQRSCWLAVTRESVTGIAPAWTTRTAPHLDEFHSLVGPCPLSAVRRLDEWAEVQEEPTSPTTISTHDIREYVRQLIERSSAGNAKNYYRSLCTFFRWLVDEEERDNSPTDRTKTPHVPEKPIPIVTLEQMGALLDTAASSCTRGLLAEVQTVAPVIILPLIASVVRLSAVMAFARMAEAVTDPTAIYLAVTVTAAVLTFGATLISTWVGLRTRPAVAAVAPA